MLPAVFPCKIYGIISAVPIDFAALSDYDTFRVMWSCIVLHEGGWGSAGPEKAHYPKNGEMIWKRKLL